MYPLAKMLLDLPLPVQSVSNTTKVVSSNPVHGKVYSIQHYVIKFVSVRSVVVPGTLLSSTNKTDRHDIAEILLKVVLNTINIILCTKNSKQIWIFVNFFGGRGKFGRSVTRKLQIQIVNGCPCNISNICISWAGFIYNMIIFQLYQPFDCRKTDIWLSRQKSYVRWWFLGPDCGKSDCQRFTTGRKNRKIFTQSICRGLATRYWWR